MAAILYRRISRAAVEDRAKDVASARALRGLDPALLVVGHGPVVREPGTGMDAAIARAESAAGPAMAQAQARARAHG